MAIEIADLPIYPWKMVIFRSKLWQFTRPGKLSYDFVCFIAIYIGSHGIAKVNSETCGDMSQIQEWSVKQFSWRGCLCVWCTYGTSSFSSSFFKTGLRECRERCFFFWVTPSTRTGLCAILTSPEHGNCGRSTGSGLWETPLDGPFRTAQRLQQRDEGLRGINSAMDGSQ